MSDTSTLDNFEISGIDCCGDDQETQIVLSYDLDCDCYTVEEFRNGHSYNCETFDDRHDAERYFAIHVKDTEKLYVDERAEYERGRVMLAVEALRDLVKMNIDPDAAQAISLLAELISRGKAKDVRDDLEWSLATIYRHDLVG